MATLKYLSQYFTTALNVGGGIDDSQTTGIILLDVSGVDITKPGQICITYSDPIDTSVAEWIDYTSINGSNELVGAVRGREGYSAHAHLQSATVAFVMSASHHNDVVDLLNGTEAGIKIKTALYDANGNEVIKTPATTNAVNEITLTNAAANDNPTISATGGDTNIGINLKPKGSGVIAIDGPENYAADAGSNDTYAITVEGITAYATGQTFKFKANTANTGAATLNVNSLGAKTIVKNYNATLANNDILANQLVEVIYDGTNFQMISPVSNSSSLSSKIISITRDMTVASGNVSYTGVGFTPTALVAITGFTAAGGTVFAVGMADSAKTCVNLDKDSTNYVADPAANGSNILTIVPSGGNYVIASVNSYDADGFTLAWTKSGSPTGTIYINILCFR